MFEEYVYIDITRVDKYGKVYPWKRIHEDKLEVAVERFKQADSLHIYQTIQMFKGSEHQNDEDHICDFFIDIDSEDLEESRLDAMKVLDFFYKGYLIEEDLRIWFSGNRGFHITVDHRLLGASPSPVLTSVWRHIAEVIAKKMDITTIDRAVYTRRRMWRCNNTKHGKSGLYKIELYPHELSNSIDHIRALAENPRGVLEIDGGDQ